MTTQQMMAEAELRTPVAAAVPPWWRLPKLALSISLVCLMGVLVLFYPIASGWFSDLEQAQQINESAHDVTVLSSSQQTEALDEAHRYNDALSGGASLVPNQRKPEAVGTHASAGFDYHELLAADQYGTMGRIRIPSIGVDLPIYHGTSDRVLAEGVGHLEGTALPVGGDGTHTVLTGHRGLPTSTLFTNLDQVHKGDTFTITVFGDVLTYQVIDTKIVDPEETSALDPVPGEDLVTLVTCTPLGINSHRILVTAKRILPTPPEDRTSGSAPAAGPGFPWWTLALAVTLVLLAAYVYVSGRPPRPPRRTDRRVRSK